VASERNYVVLVSFDGFRWDYTDIYDTPNFDRLAEEGVKAEYLKPSFPTKTFPNHYTLATGLYPDHHGIINNTFYAPDLGEVYRISKREMVMNPASYFGEPIWVTAEMQGLISASYFWVGSEAPIKGMHPTYWKAYDHSVPFEDRIDTVIHWLNLPEEKRPDFITLYFHEPDGIGHDFGPVSPETGEVIEYLDQLLGILRHKLSETAVGDQVNLIVLSDHGMGATSSDRYVRLSDYIKPEWIVSLYGGNPVYLADAAEGYEDSILNAFKDVQGIHAWNEDGIPAHLNYGTNARFPDMLFVADSSWSIGTGENAGRYTGGAHGYDNNNRDMFTIFFADGPAFKDGYIHPAFPNVDVYPLIAEILGLQAAETDGDLERVKGMLK
jgi:alkaline phosphatase D